MKTYRHYRPREAWTPLVLFAAIGLAGILGLAWAALEGFGSNGPPWFVFLVPLAVAGLNFWWCGTVAVEARLGDEGHVEWVAPLRKVRVAVVDILSIAPSSVSNWPFFVLKHRHGAVRFDPRLDGMHELVGELKRRNPDIELHGI